MPPRARWPPEIPSFPEASEISEAAFAPESSHDFETLEFPHAPEVQESPQAREVLESPEVPATADDPYVPEAADTVDDPYVPEAADTVDDPEPWSPLSLPRPRTRLRTLRLWRPPSLRSPPRSHASSDPPGPQGLSGQGFSGSRT